MVTIGSTELQCNPDIIQKIEVVPEMEKKDKFFAFLATLNSAENTGMGAVEAELQATRDAKANRAALAGGGVVGRAGSEVAEQGRKMKKGGKEEGFLGYGGGIFGKNVRRARQLLAGGGSGAVVGRAVESTAEEGAGRKRKMSTVYQDEDVVFLVEVLVGHVRSMF